MCNPFGFQFVVTTLKVTHGVVCLIHSKRPLKTLQAAILSFHNWQRRFPTRFLSHLCRSAILGVRGRKVLERDFDPSIELAPWFLTVSNLHWSRSDMTR